MDKDIWLEWIGLWGSGKSTAINKLRKELKKDIVFKTSNDFFKLNKFKRFSFTLINILRTPICSFSLLRIFLPKFLRGIFVKDKILISELRSFWYCYSARLFSIFIARYQFFMWEGEFHLIPFLDLNLKQKEEVVDLLLKLTNKKSIKFIILDTTLDDAIKRVQKDQYSGKNIRFSNAEFKNFRRYISKSFKHQEELIYILEKKYEKIYKINHYDDLPFQEIFYNTSK